MVEAPALSNVVDPSAVVGKDYTVTSVWLDDGRFVIVYNFTPTQSVSVVDVQARKFVGEIDTAGCGMVYAAGPRRDRSRRVEQRVGVSCADGDAGALRGQRPGDGAAQPFAGSRNDGDPPLDSQVHTGSLVQRPPRQMESCLAADSAAGVASHETGTLPRRRGWHFV